MKIWSISTAVRNPERLRNFLTVLSAIEGEEWNRANQKKFQVSLIQHKYYGGISPQFRQGLTDVQISWLDSLNDLTYDQALEILHQKDYEGGGDMRGRNSYKPLEKMGLAYIDNNRNVIITSMGRYFLRDDFDFGELFFRSFLKWQYPNPLSKDFTSIEGYNIKPFIATLHLIRKVNELCSESGATIKGISKLEFELFVPTLINYSEISNQAKNIINFRTIYESFNTNEEKIEFKREYIRENFSDFSNFNNAHDYTDNIIRYFRMTRFLASRGGGYYIDLEPRRSIEINKLLEYDDGSSINLSRDEYIEYISNIALPILPWEETVELYSIYTASLAEVNQMENMLGMIITPKEDIRYSTKEILNSSIESLRQKRRQLQDLELKIRFESEEGILEVIRTLENIRNIGVKPSLALEKWISIALNVVNDAVSIKPNHLVDDENQIVFTAPGNKPDIECYYTNFKSICEVTLLTTRDQWYNEGQPVMRHLRDFENLIGEEAYCIFIAPRLHRDTINTYWNAVKYEYEGRVMKIIPLTLSQLIQILYLLIRFKKQNIPFTNVVFKELLDTIISLTNESQSSSEWIEKITDYISSIERVYL